MEVGVNGREELCHSKMQIVQSTTTFLLTRVVESIPCLCFKFYVLKINRIKPITPSHLTSISNQDNKDAICLR